ncbi:hypothetical protein GCM10027447_08520 [Glycomyces halotolerans]
MSFGWGPGYGDPSHPTTGELPTVGDGVRGTGENHTVQIDIARDAGSRHRADTGGFARVGDGVRGTVGPVTVQIDRVPAADPAGVRGDTQLLPRLKPKREAPAPAARSERPDITGASRSMPVTRRQLGPDWTQTPLRLMAAAIVAVGVLGVSAASLLTIAEWINP